MRRKDREGERARRYYSITDAGRQSLAAFRNDWVKFAATVAGVLDHAGGCEDATGKGHPR